MPRIGAPGARLAVTRDRRAGSDHCRCADSQGSVRMFAYHLCETPPVERTADAFEAHSVSVVVPPTATTYVRSRTSGYSNAAGLFCPGLTPIAAQLGTGCCGRMGGGRMGGDGGYRW